MNKLSIILLLLTACGGKYEVGKDFEYYLKEFEALYGQRVENIEIKFGDVKKNGENVIGTCYFGVSPIIEVSLDWWQKASNLDRQVLMYHELGHCVLGRPHNNNMIDLYTPISIMNSFHIGGQKYSQHQEHYDYELITQKIKPESTVYHCEHF